MRCRLPCDRQASRPVARQLADMGLDLLSDYIVPSLNTYLRQDLEHQWGSASFIAAVLDRLDAAPTSVVVDDRDGTSVDGMLNVARRIAEA